MFRGKSHQSQGLIRGGGNSIVLHNAYCGNIPVMDIMSMEKELYGLVHGSVGLTIFVRDGKFQFSKIVKEFTRSGANDE